MNQRQQRAMTCVTNCSAEARLSQRWTMGIALLAALLSGGWSFIPVFPAGAAGMAPRSISLDTLLSEMVDRDASARWPSPAYVCKQVSSHDPHKNDPGDPATWHSNGDSGNFIHTEMSGGHREWVILDENGPGAITRFWVPLLAEKDKQIVRFYFDGSKTPGIEANLNNLISGQGFVPPPLAFISWNETDLRDERSPSFKAIRGVGADLYLPIPFSRHCKITLDSVPFYYGINYRIYEPGAAVQTFTMVNYAADKGTIDRVSSTLMALTALRVSQNKADRALGPGEEISLDLPGGAAAVRSLQVRIDPSDASQALRGLVLQMVFDGEATSWCPIGDFFGAGARLHPVRDWWRTVGADGSMMARWVMPYQHSARLTLKNVGSKLMPVGLSATTGPWKWDNRSMYFHATWHCQLGIKTRPMTDWNYLEAAGQGVYVGDTLTVFTPAAAWYGEGDERIYTDGATFPAHIGTGTEDYYGYAWGMATYFNSPFISAPQRDNGDRGNWKGYTTTSRLRLLDGIAFQSNLKTDMEIWNWADTQVDYAAATFWYARPGATSNRAPQPAEAATPIKDAPVEPAPLKIAGAIELETTPITMHSAGLQIGTQDGGLQEGQWSRGHQLFVQATKTGDFVELSIPVEGNQPRKVTLYGTKATDYGILRFHVNGQAAGKDYDAYNPTAIASGPIPLGVFTPVDEKLTLRVEVAGTNPASTGARYYFGLDCVVLSSG